MDSGRRGSGARVPATQSATHRVEGSGTTRCLDASPGVDAKAFMRKRRHKGWSTKDGGRRCLRNVRREACEVHTSHRKQSTVLEVKWSQCKEQAIRRVFCFHQTSIPPSLVINHSCRRSFPLFSSLFFVRLLTRERDSRFMYPIACSRVITSSDPLTRDSSGGSVPVARLPEARCVCVCVLLIHSEQKSRQQWILTS